MHSPVCTIRTEALRMGNFQYALWMILMSVILVSIMPIFLLIDHKPNIVDLFTFFIFVAINPLDFLGPLAFLAFLALLPVSLFIIVPRKFIRVSPTGIRIRSVGIGKSHTIDWNEIQSIKHGTSSLGVRYNNQDVLLTGGVFHKKDWLPFHKTVTYYFKEYFNITIESERARQKQLLRPKSWRATVLDKLGLLLVGASYFLLVTGFFALSAFPQYTIIITSTALIITASCVAIMRKTLQLNRRLHWHPV